MTRLEAEKELAEIHEKEWPELPVIAPITTQLLHINFVHDWTDKQNNKPATLVSSNGHN